MNRNTKSSQNLFLTSHFIRKIKIIMKTMSRKKFCTTLLLHLIIVGVLILPPTVISLQSSSVIVRSSGTIARMGNATSGSIEDIQAAVDWVTAAGGGTVYIPEGIFTFDASGSRRVNIVVPSGGIQIIGAGIDQTVLQMPEDDNADNTVMFKVTGLSKGKMRISGITFRGRPNWQTSPTGDSGVTLECCTDFRVDHCSFWDMGAHGIALGDGNHMYGISGGDIDLVSQGVIDHCEFHRIYKPVCKSLGRGYGYGVFVARAWNYLWAVPNLYPEDPWTMFGKYYKNTYVEDCYFEGCRHAVTGNFAGAYVLRYSTIEDQGMYSAVTTGHPARLDSIGMLTQEIYNVTVRNTGTYTSKHIGFLIEGGSSLIYNNTIIDITDSILNLGTSEYINDFFPLGNINNVYVWDNSITGTNPAPYISNNAGGTPVEGIDYWTDLTGAYTTAQVQSLVDAKGYVPYQYPHPLTLQEFP